MTINESTCSTLEIAPDRGEAISTSQRVLDSLKKADRTWLIIALSFVLVAIALPSHLRQTVEFTAENLWNILPFLVLSASLAGYLEAASADRLIARIFSDRVFFAIGAAAIFGALSPFCSCGVIPLIAALMVAGVPLAAVMAFWVASPIMSPSMFLITAAGIGLDFAVIKMMSAILVGLFAGGLTFFLQNLGHFKEPLKESPVSSCGGAGANSIGKSTNAETVWQVWRHPERMAALKKKSFSMTLFLGKWLTLAFLLESLMVTYVSAELLGQWLGSDSVWAIPLSAIIGVPAYLNGFAAVPIIAGLMESGMSAPAALSFMLAGAMTSIPAAIAVFSIVKRSLFVWYVLMALIGAMFAGYLYQAILALA